MRSYMLGQNNEDSIEGNFRGLYYSPSTIYQDMSERDLTNSLFNDDDQAILNIFNENKYDKDESRILVLNEKIITGDITKFKTNLKENIPKLIKNCVFNNISHTQRKSKFTPIPFKIVIDKINNTKNII